MSKELRECPFCGATDLYVVQARIEEYHSIEPEISCKKCGYTIKLKELAIDINDSPETNADWWDRLIAKKWNTRPAEESMQAEVAQLKCTLEKVKNHLVIHRDHSIQSCRQDGKVYQAMNEFMARFCNGLLELINTDTGKGVEDD